jgi:hypothetical protein
MSRYDTFIDCIIAFRGQWNIPEGEYFEVHHIIPKCMGGEPLNRRYRGNRKRLNIHDNLIWLYPLEHYKAHELLALENLDNRSLVDAWNIMSHLKGIKTSEEEYIKLRENYSKNNSGERAPFYGKKPSREHLDKMSKLFAGPGNPMWGKTGENNPTSKKVIDLDTKKIYSSLTEVCRATGLKKTRAWKIANGLITKEGYNFIYLHKLKEKQNERG